MAGSASPVPFSRRTEPPDPIQQSLENVRRRYLVDDLGAALPREVALDHAALDRGGGETLVPEGERQVCMREQVLRHLPDALRARSLAAVEADRQSRDDAADIVALDLGEEALHVAAELAAADRVEWRRDHPGGIGERHADRLGADIEAQEALAPGDQRSEVAGVAEGHGGC